jgi:hypothetical protein
MLIFIANVEIGRILEVSYSVKLLRISVNFIKSKLLQLSLNCIN